jgi:hypothetical protein
MTVSRAHTPAASNLLGDALEESRQHFRRLVSSLESLARQDKMEEGRQHIAKLEALAQELHRLLNPRDPVDRKVRQQIDRDLERMRKTFRKGWGGAIGTGILALVLAGTLGVAALIGLFLLF